MSARLLPLPLFALVLALALAVTYGATPLRPRDTGIDALFAAVPPPLTNTVAVVDIDGAALALHGPWPWPRNRIAVLLEALWQRGARVVVFDIAFVGPDRRSAGAVAADLPVPPDTADRAVLERLFPDGDALLARAMAGGDVVLGLLTDPTGEAPAPPAPPFRAGAVPPAAAARVTGLTPPFAPLLDQSAATGVMALGLDGAGVIRDVPLLVALPGTAFGGLALEAARVALGYPEIALAGDGRIGLGSLSLPIDGRALLRLHAQGRQAERARTIRATALLDATAPAEGIAGRIVLVGSSSPALGALRAVPGNPYRPSVQIQADAVGQILAGVNYVRSPAARLFDGLAVIAAALGALIAARRLPVPAGIAAITVGAAILAGVAALLVIRGGWLVDPVTPAVTLVVCYLLALAGSYWRARRERAQIRRRFGLYMPPAVVERILSEPGALRLGGEIRPIVALFTDIEGFTALTGRCRPDQLIALLDGYFGGVCAIVLGHGGTIDKIVGDAVHCFFNAPLDLADYGRHAIDCARAIDAFAEAFRLTPLAAELDLGRTRIGLHAGDAVVGDVGGGERFDYTAHGEVMNGAARLQEANKRFGTRICFSAEVAALCPGLAPHPLGPADLRGIDHPVEALTLGDA